MQQVLLCEPQWTGGTHAPINAAMLETTRLALPRARIAFMADDSHLSAVAEILSLSGRPSADYEFLPSPVGRRDRWSRGDQLSAVWRAYAKARAREARFVVLTSFSLLQVAAARAAFATIAGRCTSLAVVHSNVEHLGAALERSPERRGERILVGWSRGRRPPGTAFCVLGMRLREALVRNMPLDSAPVYSLRHPYILDAEPDETVVEERLREPVFALVGGASKGDLPEFLAVAKMVKREFRRARFVLAGALNVGDARLEKEARTVLEASPGTGMIQRSQFIRRLTHATYAVVHLDPQKYRIRVSASTLDTLSACVPAVLRAVPFNEACVADDGIPGYLYRNRDELAETLMKLAELDRPAAYRALVSDLARRRQVFQPERVAPELLGILRELQ